MIQCLVRFVHPSEPSAFGIARSSNSSSWAACCSSRFANPAAVAHTEVVLSEATSKAIFSSEPSIHIENYHCPQNNSCEGSSKPKKRKTDEDRNENWAGENLNLDALLCKMIAHLRLQTTITGTDLGLIADNVVTLLVNVMENVREKIEKFCKTGQLVKSDEDLQLFLNLFSCDSKQFSYLKYMKNQISVLKKNFKYMDPIDIFLGNRTLNAIDKVSHFKSSNVPVLEDVLTRFEDGEIFKEHPFFQKYEDAIPIVLDYDDFLVNSALGSKRDQKLGGFYVSFLNLPEHLRDFIGNVHPLVIVKLKDIKTFGIDRCLQAFMLE
uniref:Uncharacterized protein n=1 Tax=Trichogramma kaykai TaxID=54128 RepID=A0ABD2WG63_9HYME